MKEYKALGILKVSTGKVKLSKEQSHRRRKCLGDQKKGVQGVLSPIHFKVGEVFSWDGEFAKAADVEMVKPKAKKPETMKAEAGKAFDELNEDA